MQILFNFEYILAFKKWFINKILLNIQSFIAISLELLQSYKTLQVVEKRNSFNLFPLDVFRTKLRIKLNFFYLALQVMKKNFMDFLYGIRRAAENVLKKSTKISKM